MVYIIVYDGDEQKDFICGFGVNFEVLLCGEFYDCYICFLGEDVGFFGEVVCGIIGLCCDLGEDVCEVQIVGWVILLVLKWDLVVGGCIQYIFVYDDWILF